MGISTIPLAPGQKNPPRRFRWKEFQQRRPTEGELCDWHQGTDFGIAIICGQVSGGLVVRDFDKAGAYERFRDRHPDLCKSLPAVATARGAHLYCRAIGRQDTLWLIDGELRGEGAYVVAPPSVHPTGIPYRWFHPIGDNIPTVADISPFTGRQHRQATKRRDLEGREESPHIPTNHYYCVTPPSQLHPDGVFAGAIATTLPTCFGQRNACLLRLCRQLK